MSINSDLKKFALFINSKNDVNHSTTKSVVTIPFTANLANHDPLRTVKVAIVDVLFSNIFYNVRDGVDTFQYVDLFAAGRNKPASYRVTTVTIPIGYYNYDSFTAWALDNMGSYESVTYTGSIVAAQLVYYGFGSDYPALTTNDAVPASAYSLVTAKVWFQLASLGDMYQYVPMDNTVTPSTDHSNIYAGRYLIESAATYGMLHQLGYSFTEKVTPAIPGTPFKGWGQKIYSRQVSTTTQYSFDNVNWGVNDTNTTIASVVPQEVSDFTGLDDLYIHCSQLRTHYQSAIGRAPMAPNDVVAVIPINVAFGEKMSFVPNFPLDCFLTNTNITQLEFRMTNSNNIPLDFHGIDWGLTMFCEEMSDESRLQLEDNPDGATPDILNMGRVMDAGSYMEGRLKRAKSNNMRLQGGYNR